MLMWWFTNWNSSNLSFHTDMQCYESWSDWHSFIYRFTSQLGSELFLLVRVRQTAAH